jgi:hypothetical protein
MKIPTWITPEPLEVDVEVSIEDIRNALEDSPETATEAFRMLNRCSVVIKSISDEIIEDMNDAQRKVVNEFLAIQAARYSVRTDKAQVPLTNHNQLTPTMPHSPNPETNEVQNAEAVAPAAICSPCGECGMPVGPNEYHPFGVCLMFKACYDSAIVRAHLWAIQERSYNIGRMAGENCHPSTEANHGQANEKSPSVGATE